MSEDIKINRPDDPGKHCYDCEHYRKSTCTIGYIPDVPKGIETRGHCRLRVTNLCVEYGDSPGKKETLSRFLKKEA